MTSLFNSLAGGGEEPMIDNSCGLSRTQRLWAFGGCFVGGMVLSILGSIFFAFGKVASFAVCYSLGSIVSLCSTMFLFGPWGQLKRMFDKDRWIATTVYLAAIILTIVFATTMVNAAGTILVIIMIIVQFFALIWYSLSYVPYGRSMATSVVTSCFK